MLNTVLTALPICLPIFVSMLLYGIQTWNPDFLDCSTLPMYNMPAYQENLSSKLSSFFCFFSSAIARYLPVKRKKTTKKPYFQAFLVVFVARCKGFEPLTFWFVVGFFLLHELAQSRKKPYFKPFSDGWPFTSLRRE